MFAKLYEYEKEGQVLVKLDTSEEGVPEVRVYCEPGSFGVCSLAFSFQDSDEGWEKAEGAFNEFTEEKALIIARTIAESVYSYDQTN